MTSLRQYEADAQDPGKVPLQAVRSVRYCVFSVAAKCSEAGVCF